MNWFSSDSNEAQAHNELTNFNGDPQEHQAKLSHELLGSAAAYEVMEGWYDHQAKNGKPVSHAKAKEAAFGLAAAIVDREVETKGMDWIDKEEAKRHANQKLGQQIDEQGY